jgi:hypothetical protein
MEKEDKSLSFHKVGISSSESATSIHHLGIKQTRTLTAECLLCPVFSSWFQSSWPSGQWVKIRNVLGGSRFSTTRPGAVSAAAQWMPQPCLWSADSLAVGKVGVSNFLWLPEKVLDPAGSMESSAGKLIPPSGSVLLTLGSTDLALQGMKFMSCVQVSYCLFLCFCPLPVGCH